jgi:hypothetical protein
MNVIGYRLFVGEKWEQCRMFSKEQVIHITSIRKKHGHSKARVRPIYGSITSPPRLVTGYRMLIGEQWEHCRIFTKEHVVHVTSIRKKFGRSKAIVRPVYSQ